jgi:PAS domain S-box-containing protein
MTAHCHYRKIALAFRRRDHVLNEIAKSHAYSALMGALDMGFCLLRIEYGASGEAVDYRFIDTNPLFETHTGLHDAVGRSALELIPDLERSWIERYAEVARSRQPLRFEQRSDAMKRSFEVHAFSVGAEEDRLVGLLFKDITDARIRDSNRMFLSETASLFDSDIAADQIMALVGAKLGDHLGVNSCLFCRVEERTDTITTAYGWTRGGEPNLVRAFKVSDYLNEQFLIENRARRTVVVGDTDVDPRTDAAAYAALNIRAFVTVPYFVEGAWTHCFAVTDASRRDWTPADTELLETFARLVFSKLERALAHTTLSESEARFRAMADAVPQIIWITDAQGRVEFFNRQWALYTGIEYAHETAMDVAATVLHPDDAALTMSRFQEAMASGLTFEVEHRIRGASGEYRWFLVRAEAELDPATGMPRRWYGASVDIHDRRLVEQALAESDRRKDEFIATLAHELRNPLAPIRTGLSLLDMDVPAETAAQTREVMARQLSHMVRLIDDLLDISRINSNKIELRRESLDIRSVLEEAVEAHRSAIDHAGHQLFLSFPGKPLYVEADRTRLVQIVGNLLTNAAKYTPHGGRIELSADSNDGDVRISVQDSGVGIDASALGSIFDMFAQVPGHVHRAQGGLGIGLSLVKRLVEMHGGTVHAESAGHGAGATFRVRLPHASAPASQADEDPALADPRMQPALDVLVLDDNADAAAMMKAVLEAGGHRVAIAHTGPDAIGLASGQRMDVAFLDIGLPGMDGYEVARRLRELRAADPITLIALTGWGADSDKKRAYASGFDHHLTKPVDAHTVSELLGTLSFGRPR